MHILMSVLVIIINCILYMAFGSLVCIGRKAKYPLPIVFVAGFFAYYACFFVVCLPIMFTYRPLSLLSTIWSVFVVFVLAISFALNIKNLSKATQDTINNIRDKKAVFAVVIVATIVQMILVSITYNFTLDAAYYVANVATSVDTNMINVYDPFTGAWQDHYELRYAFATYSIHDAVVCQLTHIPALIETKTVMSSTVMLISNVLLAYIAGFLCRENHRQELLMYAAMIFVNFTFITLYTSSNFLVNRTYEGKSIVGNIAVIAIFVMYMYAVREDFTNRFFVVLFTMCAGVATVSSTANMIIPAEVCLLFTPYVIKHKKYKTIPKFALCILPELIMLIIYVLYVKGFFAIHTYPRY